jgi:D-lyxose ketol-isomerase
MNTGHMILDFLRRLRMVKERLQQYRLVTMQYLSDAGIVLTPSGQNQIEIVDFGLGHLDTEGLELITYINTDRYCAKELVLFPMQTCPEHLHPPVGNDPGKEETFRCRSGLVRLFVEGAPTAPKGACIPPGSEAFYTAAHEVTLRPGEQFTIMPGIRHWFQAGETGAVISEFSSTSRDSLDIFTDHRISRKPLTSTTKKEDQRKR